MDKEHKELISWVLAGEDLELQNSSGKWEETTPRDVLRHLVAGYSASQFRIKPRKINIAGCLVDAPLSEPPEIGTLVFVVAITAPEGYVSTEWDDTETCKRWLSQGLIQPTAEFAKAQAYALYRACKG